MSYNRLYLDTSALSRMEALDSSGDMPRLSGMYILYYSPGACSLAIHALLNELNVPFELACVDIHKTDNRKADYLKLNSRGQIPVLIDGELLLRESAAIAIHLLTKHPHPLLPAEEMRRAKALEWLAFCNSSLHQAYGSYFLLSKNLKDPAARQAACELAAKRIGFFWRDVEAHLQTQPYLCVDEVTIADFFLTVIANWTRLVEYKVTLGTHIIQLCNKVIERPSFAKALQTEEIRYTLQQ